MAIRGKGFGSNFLKKQPLTGHTLCQYPALEPPFAWLILHVELMPRMSLMLYHALIDRYLTLGPVYFLCYFIQIVEYPPNHSEGVAAWACSAS